MFDWLLLTIALSGTALAGWIDLKTTEVPDEIPYFMIGSGLVLHFIHSLITGTWSGLLQSAGIGILFLGFGYILYYAGQWGEADVFVLGGVGFLMPQPLHMFNISGMSSQIFPLTLLINTFVVGGIYALVYALIVSLGKPEMFPQFLKDIKSNFRRLLVILFVYLLCSYAIALYLKIDLNTNMILLYIPLIASLFFLYRFAKVLDNVGFRKKIKTKDLRNGDVLAEKVKLRNAVLSDKLWVGLEPEQIKHIQKIKKEIWIKEGIRFVPTFFLAILATWFCGDLLSYLILNLL